MSQKVTRKSAVSEDKDKKQADNPVKDMKKKMAATAEKEKQPEKSAEKPAEKLEKNKSTDKHDKSTEKIDKGDKVTDKKVEKNGPVAEKVEKKADKKEVEKKDVQEKKEDKGENSGKTEKEKDKKEKPKQNGSHNGFGDEAANGNGGSTVSSEDEVMLVIDDHQDDDLFPELTYEDSDAEFEPSSDGHSRSYTRRSQDGEISEDDATVCSSTTYDSDDDVVFVDEEPVLLPCHNSASYVVTCNPYVQVKTTRTPETPRPASDKQTEKDSNTDDLKVLKMKEDIPASTDRKLRSADSPKPESKKQEKEQEKQEKGQEKQDKGIEKQEKGQEKQEKDVSKDTSEKETEKGEKEKGEKSDKCEVEVIIDVETEEESRKPDTNYSKSRVKVSPYRRSMRIADQTTSSVMANYTGNNTTMEMDITETSLLSQSQSLDDSSYLNTIRNMRGRRSYKKLGELSFKHTARSTPTTSVTEQTRPTGTVVGRKRKPDVDSSVEVGLEAGETSTSAHTKRMRLLDRIAMPFRRTVETSLPARRAAEIVGINTDLPLTAPVATPETFDPESLKAAPLTPPPEVSPELEREKRCIIM